MHSSDGLEPSQNLKSAKKPTDKGEGTLHTSMTPDVTYFLSKSTDDPKNIPHSRLTIKSCLKFVLTGVCTFGHECCYIHLVFPNGYRKADRRVIDEWIGAIDILSWNPNTKSVYEMGKASKVYYYASRTSKIITKC